MYILLFQIKKHSDHNGKRYSEQSISRAFTQPIDGLGVDFFLRHHSHLNASNGVVDEVSNNARDKASSAII